MQNASEGRTGDEILTTAIRASASHTTQRALSRLCAAAIVVGVLNFLLFIAGTLLIGGDAVNGKAESGRFYVWGYHNVSKQYTEVSRPVFNYSRWHCYSVWVTWPLVILAGFVERRIQKED